MMLEYTYIYIYIIYIYRTAPAEAELRLQRWFVRTCKGDACKGRIPPKDDACKGCLGTPSAKA